MPPPQPAAEKLQDMNTYGYFLDSNQYFTFSYIIYNEHVQKAQHYNLN